MAGEVRHKPGEHGVTAAKGKTPRRGQSAMLTVAGSWVCHCSMKTQSEGVLTGQSKGCPTNNNSPVGSSPLGRKVSASQSTTRNSAATWSCLHRRGWDGGCGETCSQQGSTDVHWKPILRSRSLGPLCWVLKTYSRIVLNQWTAASGFWKLLLEVSEKLQVLSLYPVLRKSSASQRPSNPKEGNDIHTFIPPLLCHP